MTPQLLTTDDVGELFRTDRATIRRWARNGTLTPIRVGHRMLFDRRDVEALIQRRRGDRNGQP